ncbi:MAG: VanZ family protein [Candidatus Acidiferrales bacterium]
MTWLKRWWPALVWGTVMSLFSTSGFTSENTSHFIIPFLKWLLPHASFPTLELLHHYIRKCAHFTEYFIFSLLILRGIRAGRKGTHLRWALVSILLVVCYAAFDEFHQSFVPGRTALVTDVFIDSFGGIVAQIAAGLVMLWSNARQKRGLTHFSGTPLEPTDVQ